MKYFLEDILVSVVNEPRTEMARKSWNITLSSSDTHLLLLTNEGRVMADF